VSNCKILSTRFSADLSTKFKNFVRENVSSRRLFQAENERFSRNHLSKSKNLSNRLNPNFFKTCQMAWLCQITKLCQIAINQIFKNLSDGSNLSNPETLSNRMNLNFFKTCQMAWICQITKLCQIALNQIIIKICQTVRICQTPKLFQVTETVKF
jgi:hypothetical protein